jgi:predicted HicB family RNase H-like nuclease
MARSRYSLLIRGLTFVERRRIYNRAWKEHTSMNSWVLKVLRRRLASMK